MSSFLIAVSVAGILFQAVFVSVVFREVQVVISCINTSGKSHALYSMNDCRVGEKGIVSEWHNTNIYVHNMVNLNMWCLSDYSLQ